MILTLVIEKIAFGGDAIAHAPDGRIVFIDRGLPGEKITCEVVRDKKRMLFARMISSESARNSACPYSDRCGGCRFWRASYEEEFQWKSAATLEAITRISHKAQIKWPKAKLIPDISPVKYRQRARFQVTKTHKLAFFAKGSHEKISIESCPVLAEEINELIPKMPILLKKYRPKWVFLEQESTFIGAIFNVENLHSFAETSLPKGLSCLIARRGKQRMSLAGKDAITRHYGSSIVAEPIGGFSQGNARMNKLLVQLVLAEVGSIQNVRVLELFSGSGNFTFPLLDAGAFVDAIDVAGAAIKAAKNAHNNGSYTKGRFFTANLHSSPLPKQCGSYEVIIADPPRGGMAHWLLKAIDKTNAKTLVYVSCDPPALARDVARLHLLGWKPRSLSLLDLFPRTAHIEAVVTLKRSAKDSTV